MSDGHSDPGGFRRPPATLQAIGSVLVALALVAIAIVVVTAKFGATPVAELEAREERVDAREDARKDREKAREDREKAAEDRAEGG
jgi:hypothetical protein